MLDKLTLEKKRFFARFPLFIFFFALFSLPKQLHSQDLNSTDSLKIAIKSFIEDQSQDYRKKHLNLRKRDIGNLESEPFDFKDYFMLESKEEFENNLGYTTEREIYFMFYSYESETDRQYALKYWMQDFIEGKTIRAGRPVRSYAYAKPTIILINDKNIIVCNYECKYFDEDNYDYWKDELMEHFGDKYKTMVIEIECEGPLEWTRNAPDPKNRGLF